MIKETKIGEAVIVKQTTYYFYSSEEDQKNDKYWLCTSDPKKAEEVKRQMRNFQFLKFKRLGRGE
jgi:hypothetical protein